MSKSTVLLKTPVIFDLPTTQRRSPLFEKCTLSWEQESLLVFAQPSRNPVEVPALQNTAWLRECLIKSPVSKVYLDPTMAEDVIEAWANICRDVGKQVYLQLPEATDLPQTRKPLFWGLKRIVDWLIAAFLSVVTSPVLILSVITARLLSSGPVFDRQWHAGYQGKLFQTYRFRWGQTSQEAKLHCEIASTQQQSNHWLQQLGVRHLPLLLNVLSGEMSLVGPKPLSIHEAVQIEPKLQKRLKAMPGLIGHEKAVNRKQTLHKAVYQDLAYLRGWNLLRDFGILLLAIPRGLFHKPF